MIDFDAWKNIDIRIGTIISAEKIEKSKKLLKLTVDFGDETRVIVSGIASNYSPDDIVNKQMPFVTNLEPREIFGIESQGMILACHDEEDNPILLYPEKPVRSGNKVS